jgi:hypothetical protein
MTCDVGEFLDEAVKGRHRRQPEQNTAQVEFRAFGALVAIFWDVHEWLSWSLDTGTGGDGVGIGARKSAGQEID